MAAKTSVKLVISSETRLIDLVHAASESLAGLAGFGADDALNVGLAVREAVINAMLHGNREDAELKVTVALTADADRLVARISDQGDGFDPARTPDPRVAVNLLRNSGRGLLLINAFVDSVKFRTLPRGGTQVTLVKRLPAKGGNGGNGGKQIS
jgi:serine/threonine-protein kinase RsbW